VAKSLHVCTPAGCPTYTHPDSTKQQLVQDFWNGTCRCSPQPRSCGLNNSCQKLHSEAAFPPSYVMRCYLFSLQQQQWVNGGSIDEFIWLLNMRQRAIEETGAPCLQVLYLDTFFFAYVHPPAFPAVSSTASAAEQLEYSWLQ